MREFDNSYRNNGVELIAGVDEAGRGPLAGPVVAASVIFEVDCEIEGVDDSKKIPEKKRELLYNEIVNNCISFGIGIVGPRKIEEINILQASLLAMKIAINSLNIKPDLILIDGNKTFSTNIPTIAIVKGDSKSFSIAAASILAKVTRDRIMLEKSEQYPCYLWNKNKGYATKEHREAILKYGPVDEHRKTFLGNLLPKEDLRLI